jgi:EmrB/QacA subfamily drug resistance transporter
VTRVERVAPDDTGLDPRRWVTLGVVVAALFVVVVDSSVLNVAIPTILREFDTTLPSLQWVVTGYSLTFASLLVIGGRLGDIFGHRRIFIIGAGLFTIGSLLAALSWGVTSLVVGEALIEGIGASLMMPATLAILSSTFTGRERATAFAAWGAVAGAAVAFGPVVGGFLTTNYSWRWSFGINVVIAPLTILGAVIYMKPVERAPRRTRIDFLGAALVSSGMFLLVFALSEGSTYGWWRPIKTFRLGDVEVWPASNPVSFIPLVLLAAAALLTTFVLVERAKERRDEDPLFPMGQLHHRSFRYGLITTAVLAGGQLGLLFALPVFLQDGKGLSAEENGLWILPLGIVIILASQLGAVLTRRIGTTRTVQVGLVSETIGLVVVALSIRPSMTFLELLPGFVLFGLGVGFATSQLTNVILSDVDLDKSGVASGANTTVRQVGAALGIAVIGSILTVQTIHHTTERVRASPVISAPTKVRSAAAIEEAGPSFQPPPGTPPREAAALSRALDHGVADGARFALLFAAGLVTIGSFLSLLIPPVGPFTVASPAAGVVEKFEAFEPIDPDPALLADADAPVELRRLE